MLPGAAGGVPQYGRERRALKRLMRADPARGERRTRAHEASSPESRSPARGAFTPRHRRRSAPSSACPAPMWSVDSRRTAQLGQAGVQLECRMRPCRSPRVETLPRVAAMLRCSASSAREMLHGNASHPVSTPVPCSALAVVAERFLECSLTWLRPWLRAAVIVLHTVLPPSARRRVVRPPLRLRPSGPRRGLGRAVAVLVGPERRPRLPRAPARESARGRAVPRARGRHARAASRRGTVFQEAVPPSRCRRLR